MSQVNFSIFFAISGLYPTYGAMLNVFFFHVNAMQTSFGKNILKLEVFEFPMSQFVDNVVYVSLMCKFQKPFQNGLIFGRPTGYDEVFSGNRLHLLRVRLEDSQRR